MLVGLKPSLSNNNYKTQSFKANPYIDTKKISSVAEAMCYEGLVSPSSKKIAKTAEELVDLNYAIQQCYSKGQKAVAFVLERVKKQWQ